MPALANVIQSYMANTGKTLAIVGGIVLVLVAIRVGLGVAHKPDDQQLIREAIQRSIQDSKEGKANGVLQLLSDDLKVNSTTMADTGQIAQFIRTNKPDLTVDDDKALVTGDEARVISPITLKIPLIGIEQKIKNVTLVFKKEDSHGFLFLPERKWKLTDVQLPDTAIQDAIMGN
ncbi:hypothetical protein BH11ARM2_BH11ARM2_02390 [soil metagenome]